MTRVAHNKSIRSHSLTDALGLICLKCRKRVNRFVLRNEDGKIVWPVPRNAVLPPRRPKKKRVRRRPVEPDPEPYILHLDGNIIPPRWRT